MFILEHIGRSSSGIYSKLIGVKIGWEATVCSNWIGACTYNFCSVTKSRSTIPSTTENVEWILNVIKFYITTFIRLSEVMSQNVWGHVQFEYLPLPFGVEVPGVGNGVQSQSRAHNQMYSFFT